MAVEAAGDAAGADPADGADVASCKTAVGVRGVTPLDISESWGVIPLMLLTADIDPASDPPPLTSLGEPYPLLPVAYVNEIKSTSLMS
jgi:hypothetical protein